MRNLRVLLPLALLLSCIVAATVGASPASAAGYVCVKIYAKDQYGGMSTTNAIFLDGSAINTTTTRCFVPNTSHTLRAQDIGYGSKTWWQFQYWSRRTSGGSWNHTSSRSTSFTATTSWNGGEFYVFYNRSVLA
jgi:hypothetical protein